MNKEYHQKSGIIMGISPTIWEYNGIIMGMAQFYLLFYLLVAFKPRLINYEQLMVSYHQQVYGNITDFLLGYHGGLKLGRLHGGSTQW